ncbi:hypothetical protein V6N13_069090 [Hibiscus sabdariffa]
MVDSGIGALQSLFHLEDFPPLVFTQVAEGRAVAIGGIEAVVDAGAASAAGTVVSEGAAQLNQGKFEWNSLNQSLGFFPPVENRNGQVLVQPPSVVLSNGAQQWSNALVGNFLSKSPPLGVFQRTVDRLWGKEGSITIRFLAPSVYILIFPSQRVRDWVLETGPWHIQQKAIVLRRWKPGLKLEELKLTSAPIWIKLWHVSLELYSQQGLSYVASAVGRPLYSDRATTLKQHLEFAKVCVEVGAVNDILGSVLVDIGNDTLVCIVVEVVWSPPRCKHCMIFGHSDEKCGKVVCDNAIDSVPHRAPVELSTGAHERDGGSLNDVVDSVFVCDELQVEGAGEQFGIVHGVVSVSVLEDRVTRENGVQIICAESPNKFAALSGANEEDPNSLCGFQVVEPKPELGIPKRGRIAAGGVAELMQQLKPKAKEPKVKKKGRGKGGGKGGGSPIQ